MQERSRIAVLGPKGSETVIECQERIRSLVVNTAVASRTALRLRSRIHLDDVVVDLDVAGTTAVRDAMGENAAVGAGVVPPNDRRLPPAIHTACSQICERRDRDRIVFHEEIVSGAERRRRGVAVYGIEPLQEIAAAWAVDSVVIGYAVDILLGAIFTELKDGLIGR